MLRMVALSLLPLPLPLPLLLVFFSEPAPSMEACMAAISFARNLLYHHGMSGFKPDTTPNLLHHHGTSGFKPHDRTIGFAVFGLGFAFALALNLPKMSFLGGSFSLMPLSLRQALSRIPARLASQSNWLSLSSKRSPTRPASSFARTHGSGGSPRPAPASAGPVGPSVTWMTTSCLAGLP